MHGAPNLLYQVAAAMTTWEERRTHVLNKVCHARLAAMTTWEERRTHVLKSCAVHA